MTYHIIQGRSIGELESQINDLIKSDHGSPIGGVSVISQEDRNGDSYETFFQAILTR